MKIDLPAGKYVVAVSGGVDSVVLLDLLAGWSTTHPTTHPGTHPTTHRLVVAHFDHGIRPDSAADCRFVASLADKYSLPFESAEGALGSSASEALARQKRYQFLEKVRQDAAADAIITAHHQDDLLETAIINLMRGTGRRGLSSLKSTDIIKRPLLNYPKLVITQYARNRELDWREDSTNQTNQYLRNHVRHNVLPRLDRARLLELVENASRHNAEIDKLLSELVSQPLDRQFFISLDHATSREVMAVWLRRHDVISYDTKTLQRLVVASKTARRGSRHNIVGNHYLLVDDVIKFVPAGGQN